jgi:hypothetical protein
LLGAEERTKSAELELYQRHEDGGAHDRACDKPAPASSSRPNSAS